MPVCLVVDGSAIVRKVLHVLLMDHGFEVVEAAAGREGLELFEILMPRLAIVEAGVDDMSALDVLRRMRRSSMGRTKVLYCTTQFDMLELQRAHAAGATDVLIKPFDRASLSAKLHALGLADTAAAAPDGRSGRQTWPTAREITRQAS